MNLLCLFLAVAAFPMHTLMTRWADGVTPENVHQEYPRPQMVRKNWVNLNGIWKIQAVRFDNAGYLPGADPATHDILVPFPIESQLSGAQSILKDDASHSVFHYSRSFNRPKGERVLLHFGAVNWQCVVQVNGKQVGRHTGGYDPFTFDITSALTTAGSQTLQVQVTNPIDGNFQPRGKQVRKPGGIFYTASTGIWQTVWLEGVNASYIRELKVEPDRKSGQVVVTTDAVDELLGSPSAVWQVKVEVLDRGRVIAESVREFIRGENVPEDPGRGLKPTAVQLRVPDPVDWSPETPHLYDLRVSLLNGNRKVLDQITSYFAFRDISLMKNGNGQPQIALNGKPYFLIGTLDQGFWPDGIYTAPSDAALKYDLEVTKRLGFNMIRKHVKVEPERWYYWCDKLGIVVMQDMPSGDKFIGGNDPDIERSPESAKNFRAELQAMVDTHRNHPSILVWVLYNEGWGQWNTPEMTTWLKSYDPSRLVDSNTGWSDRGVGDFNDIHSYPGPDSPAKDQNRAIFLGEFGGLGLPVPGHMWQEKGWGYQSFKTSQELTDRFVEIFEKLKLLQAGGLSGAVYTQTTDCETELNGLMTYDRAIIKMNEARARKAISALHSR